jgi:hypothetical protein
LRPLYENEASLEDEQRIAAVTEQTWECKFRKLPIKNRIDFALTTDDGLMAYAEIKKRKNSIKAYKSWLISLDKWLHAKQIAEASNGVPMIFIVEWDEGIYWMRQDEVIFRVGVGGRSDRKDELDKELCVFVNVDQFRPLLKS